MQKISKKVLALILCLAMILSVPFSAAAAGDGTSSREALLSAWKNLVYEKYTPLAEAKAEGTAPGIELISSLPNELGLTTQQKSVFGSKIVKFTGTGAVWTEVDKDVALKIYDGEVSFDTTKVGVYTTFDQIELHAMLGNNYPLPSGWNLVNKGCTIMELKDLNGLIEGLVNGTIDAGGNSLSIISDYVSGGNGNIYVGAVMGVNYTKETVPAEVSSMSDKELYDYVVANVMLDKYVDGVEEFEAALNELFKAIFVEENPEKAPIIIAWGNLLKEEAVTLAWGKETTSIPAELNLTDAQKALLGDRLTVINRDADGFVQRTAHTALNESLTANIASLNIKKVQFSLYTDIAEVELHPYSDGNFLNGWNITGNGFKTIDVTSDMAAFLNGTKAFSSYSYISDYSYATGNVYIGALLGYRDVKETVPMDAYNWSLDQLFVEAAKLDTTKYVGGVEEFNAALDALYAKVNPEATNLINAWGNLVGEEYVTIAYPGSVAAGSPTLGETSALTGLSDEQRAKMGSHYWAMNAYGDKVQGINWVDQNSIGKCDSYFFVIYAPGGGYKGQIYTQFNGGGDIYTAANGFVTVNVAPSSNWWSILQMCTENYGTIYVGSVVGRRTVNATIPAEVYSMTEKELYDYVVANVNTANYTAGVEEFNAALAELKEVTKVIVNGNFEKGSVIGWDGDIAIDNTVANGTYSAKINGTANYSANLKENETYLVTFKAYREDVANNFGFSVVSGDSEVLYTTTSEFTGDVAGEFVEFKAVIKSNVNTAEFTIISNGSVWVDDFAVTEYEAKGDSNLDGVIDIKDLVRIKKYALQLLINNMPAADINSDGLVDSVDIVALRKLIMSI